jgi:hypothetical protein
MKYTSLSWILPTLGAVALTGCATPTGYDKAFAQSTALSGNARSFGAPTDQVFRAAKVTLVQRGFTIEQADAQSGLIRAARSLQDAKDPKLAYLITGTVDISPAPTGHATIVTVSASEQTVLHKESNTYYHFLGLVPIPTGKDYQTVVRREGNISTKQLYDDFFDAMEKNLQTAAVTSPPTETRAAIATPTSEATPPGTTISPAVPAATQSILGLAPAARGQAAATLDTIAAGPVPDKLSAPTESRSPAEADQTQSLVTGPNPFAQPTADRPQ